MKRRSQRNLWITVGLFVLFILWTAAVRCIDVQAIGPNESSVGFAAVNGFFHSLTGVHWTIYTITDWLGLVPLFFVSGFGLLGLFQWIKRRSLWKVDTSILVLGGFYVLVMGAYILFEVLVINDRPVLIDGYLEASYPSTTTMLVLCVMPTAIMQLNRRMKQNWVRKAMICILAAFTILMVVGRLLSGVHWLTDIVGGILLSAALVMLYCTMVRRIRRKSE